MTVAVGPRVRCQVPTRPTAASSSAPIRVGCSDRRPAALLRRVVRRRCHLGSNRASASSARSTGNGVDSFTAVESGGGSGSNGNNGSGGGGGGGGDGGSPGFRRDLWGLLAFAAAAMAIFKFRVYQTNKEMSAGSDSKSLLGGATQGALAADAGRWAGSLACCGGLPCHNGAKVKIRSCQADAVASIARRVCQAPCYPPTPARLSPVPTLSCCAQPASCTSVSSASLALKCRLTDEEGASCRQEFWDQLQQHLFYLHPLHLTRALLSPLPAATTKRLPHLSAL
jgi:hypothetical protein